MKKIITHSSLFSGLLFMSMVACGQPTKIKTITIIDGDTTISESNGNEPIGKTMQSDDTNGTSGKHIVKTIRIETNSDSSDEQAMAYAFTDGTDENTNVQTDDDGKETRIIIKSKGGKTPGTNRKDETKVERKMKLIVNNTTAHLELETGNSKAIAISVLDENGKQVFYDTQSNGTNYKKDIPLNKKGVYFLNIVQDKTCTNHKIIVD